MHKVIGKNKHSKTEKDNKRYMDGKKIMYISEEVSKEEGDGEKGV